MATYQSSLIEALRGKSAEPSIPSGMTFLPNPVNAPAPAMSAPRQRPTGGAFNPEKLVMQGMVPKVIGNRLQFAPAANDSADSGPGGDYMSGFSFDPTPVGQGINNSLADFGLALMAYGEAGKGIAPGSLLAGIAGNYIAGQQADRMGNAADALASMQQSNLPGMFSVSDANGNVYSMSTPDSIAAADAAMFGGMDMGGYSAADGVGSSGFDSTGSFDSGGWGW